MSEINLGRLHKVELREAWASESSDFTPWLAKPENLQLLGETVEMDLELESQEKRVGCFRADIFCRDTIDDSCVLIENQLERTDHGHLGQLLTYTAGLNAVTIIWIAERFTDEHRAALDWLNEKTPEEIKFFGLEVELWRIGESAMAPKFNIVSKPNAWTRSIVKSTSNTESHQFCWDYWSGVIQEIRPSGILLDSVKPFRRANTRFAVGWHTFWLNAYFNRPGKSLGIWVSSRGPFAFENYDKLLESKEQIEASFGQPLVWRKEESQGTCSLIFKGYDPENVNDWPRQHKFIAEKIVALYHAVVPFVKPLDSISGDEPEE